MRSVYIFGGLLLSPWEELGFDGPPNQTKSVITKYSSCKETTTISRASLLIQKKWISASPFNKDQLGNYIWVDYTDKEPEDPQRKESLKPVKTEKLLEDLSPLVGIQRQAMLNGIRKVWVYEANENTVYYAQWKSTHV